MNLPAVCVVTAAAAADANRVWEAIGRGFPTFTRKLCAVDPNATHETTPTHYLMSDVSASDTDVAAWQAMADGQLPTPVLPWGTNGFISESAAIEAVSAANLQVYSASGDVIPTDHVNGILSSRGLMYVPDEPI